MDKNIDDDMVDVKEFFVYMGTTYIGKCKYEHKLIRVSDCFESEETITTFVEPVRNGKVEIKVLQTND